MKVFQFLTAAVVAMMTVGAVSCSDSKDDEPTSPNSIYLSIADGQSTITAGTDEVINVSVNLSNVEKNDITLEFEAEGENAQYIELFDNPATVKAGTTVSSFGVKAAEGISPESKVSVTLTIKNIDANRFTLKQNVTVTVLPKIVNSDLTEQEQALIDGWKSKYGVDLTPWIGSVKLSGTLEFPGDGTLAPFVSPETVTLSGFSIFGINEDADSDTPVIDMLENPMGMSDYLYKSFINLTVGDKEYFALEDDGLGLELMDLINWNSESEESFAVTLPGLKIKNINNGVAEIEFVAEGEHEILDSKGNPIYSEEFEGNLIYNYATSWIPFDYTYSAWSRQLALVEEGDPKALELLTYEVSAAPASYLGMTGILEDEWAEEMEDGEDSHYVAPKGTINFNDGTMTFEFPFDHSDQYGYSVVRVTYTLE